MERGGNGLKDDQIIRLFFERSEQAIAELSHAYGALCKNVALHILGNAQDAEECVNDTYIAAWNSIPPQKPNKLSLYLAATVRNISIQK